MVFVVTKREDDLGITLIGVFTDKDDLEDVIPAEDAWDYTVHHINLDKVHAIDLQLSGGW